MLSCGMKATVALGQCAEAVFHGVDVQALKVGDVACDVEGENLPLPLTDKLVAAGPAAQQEAALRGFVAVAHDVLPGLQGTGLHRQAEDGIPLLG
jgi:hypothetical protein